MKTGIGKYIHLTASGYNQYGITKKNKSGSSSFDFNNYRDMKLRQAKGNSFKDDGELKEIGDALSAIFNGKGNNDNQNVIIQDIWNTILEKLDEEFGEALGSIDYSTGNIYSNSKSSSKKLQKAGIGNTKYIHFNTLMRRVAIIESMLDGKMIQSNTDRTVIKSFISAFKKELATIDKLNQDAINDFASQGFAANKLGSRIPLSALEDADGVNWLAELNNIIARVKSIAKGLSVNAQKGQLLEYAIPMVQSMGIGLAQKAPDQAIKDVVGKNMEKVHFKPAFFADNIDLGRVGFQQVIDEDGSTFYISSQQMNESQGKVDVQLNLNSGKVAKISAKNINLGESEFDDIHLVSGTSLLFLLQDESSDFVNHYLNLAAIHNFKTDFGVINGAQLKAAREAVKVIVLIKALMGGGYGRSTANVFLVNDNSKSGRNSIKVLAMEDVLNKIMENLNLYLKVISSSSKNGSLAAIDSYKFKNDYVENVPSGDARIANLLADVHAKKLNVLLSKDVIRNISNNS